MSEYVPMRNEIGQINGSTLSLLPNSLRQIPHTSQTFDLNSHDGQRVLINYLLEEPLPDLIIKIIGTNNGQSRSCSRASIQNAFKEVMQTVMKQSNIWLLNGTRAMIDLTEYDKKIMENDQIDPNIVTCEPFGKSKLLIYHSTKYRLIDKILSEIQQQQQEQTFPQIPFIALLMQGDTSSVADIAKHITKQIPVIILKGTGPIANRLASVYEPIGRRSLSVREELSEVDLRTLIHIKNSEQSFIYVCQPGKNELNESLLQAIGAAIQVFDKSRARTDKLCFAMRWNKIDYAQIHILNYNTIIDWTDDELDRCLESAILLNAVSFVELLFEYGASLQRLALISNSNRFQIEPDRRKSQLVEMMIKNIPVVTHFDSIQRVRVYFRFLYCWAVEKQYFELVMSICTRLDDSIIAMLLVCQWCEYKEKKDSLTSTRYREHRRQFEMYAAHILDLCYADNEKQTRELLDETSVLYQDQQASILIDDLRSKPLVSTKCMQSHMNTVWYGNYFHKDKNFVWELLICLSCICPLLLLIPVIRDRVLQWDSSHAIGQDTSKFWNRIIIKSEPLRRFYQGNAVIRFHYNMVSYTAFLLLFSYTILFDYFPLNIYNETRSNIYRLPIPLTEIVVHIFLASIALEELRQIYLHVKSVLVKSPYWNKLSEVNRHRNTIWSFYRNDPWNVLDFVAFILWFIGLISRFIVEDHAFELSKICMSLDLCLWYMRCLHVFLVSEKLGPKLLMIFHTMKDLMSFLCFILIFLFAYTVTTYSLISTSAFVTWSDSTHFTTIQTSGNLTNGEILRTMIEWGTWKIFGGTSLVTSDSVKTKYLAKNDAYGFVTLMLTITFLVIAYVLLLNNLIALFNFTIQRVHGESQRAWCYHFHVVLNEYEEKDFFVPPFNLLLWPISYLMRKKLEKTNKDRRSDTFIEKDDHDKEQRRRCQQRIAEQYWKKKQINENGFISRNPYVCRQCKCHGAESDYIESTFL